MSVLDAKAVPSSTLPCAAIDPTTGGVSSTKPWFGWSGGQDLAFTYGRT